VQVPDELVAVDVQQRFEAQCLAVREQALMALYPTHDATPTAALLMARITLFPQPSQSHALNSPLFG
jgi:hypothetical protein